MDEIPPLSSLAREFLACERELPAVPATRRGRAIARARSAALAGSAPAAFRPSGWVPRMRWAAAATVALAGMAAAAGATMIRWRSPAPSEGQTAALVAGSRGHSAGARVESSVAEVPAADPAPAAGESPPEPVPTRGPEVSAPGKHPAARTSSADELRVLAPARDALARRDFGAALAAVLEHSRRFREGRLVEEREALRVKALVGLGRANEARAAAAAFRQRFPRSALLPAIGEPPAGP